MINYNMKLKKEIHEKLSEMAKENNCSIKTLILSKVFKIDLVQPEIKTYSSSTQYKAKRKRLASKVVSTLVSTV